MTLNELKAGDVALIKEIETKPDTKRRLMDIGLTRGAEIEVLRFAPFGDPVEISVKDFCLALRMSDAKNILVTKIKKAETGSETEPKSGLRLETDASEMKAVGEEKCAPRRSSRKDCVEHGESWFARLLKRSGNRK